MQHELELAIGEEYTWNLLCGTVFHWQQKDTVECVTCCYI